MFATSPLLAGIDKISIIFVSVSSVLIQGTTLFLIAKWLEVALPEKAKNLNATDMLCGRQGRGATGLPQNAIIAMIKRDDSSILPNESTKIEAQGTLIILADRPGIFEAAPRALKGQRLTPESVKDIAPWTGQGGRMANKYLYYLPDLPQATAVIHLPLSTPCLPYRKKSFYTPTVISIWDNC